MDCALSTFRKSSVFLSFHACTSEFVHVKTSFLVAVTKVTTKKVCGPSGAGEVVCKWLHVPLH